MNLANKKELASRTLKVGKERIAFVNSRISEIKEAITKQDMKELHSDGAIRIKEVTGRKKNEKKRKRSPGNIRKNVNTRKQDYVIMTRKLRTYVANLKRQGRITKEQADDIRKKIRNRYFRSKAHLKEFLEGKK